MGLIILHRTKPNHGIVAANANAYGFPVHVFPAAGVNHYGIVAAAAAPTVKSFLGTHVGGKGGNFKSGAAVVGNFFGLAPHAFGTGIVAIVAALCPRAFVAPTVQIARTFYGLVYHQIMYMQLGNLG